MVNIFKLYGVAIVLHAHMYVDIKYLSLSIENSNKHFNCELMFFFINFADIFLKLLVAAKLSFLMITNSLNGDENQPR